MKYLITLLFTFFTFTLSAQDYRVVKFDKVQEILDSKSDTLYVLNFWATWCQPCVKELPYFEEMKTKFEGEKLKIILISMDFKSDVEERLEPFLEKRQLQNTVWFLDETKQNEFIPKVEEKWSGAIPFTLILRGSTGFRFWKEGKWSERELEDKLTEEL